MAKIVSLFNTQKSVDPNAKGIDVRWIRVWERALARRNRPCCGNLLKFLDEAGIAEHGRTDFRPYRFWPSNVDVSSSVDRELDFLALAGCWGQAPSDPCVLDNLPELLF